MTLQFAEKINNNLTFFIGKILNGLIQSGNISEMTYTDFRFDSEFYDFLPDNLGVFLPKIHTVRNSDTKFKVGTKIHFKQWTGRPYHSKNMNFAPIAYVKSVQNIKVLEFLMTNSDTSFQMPDNTIYGIEIDGIRQNKQQIHNIAINDGFVHEVEFFKYFKRFEGKIIHWTDVSY